MSGRAGPRLPWGGDAIVMLSLVALLAVLVIGTSWFGSAQTASISRQAMWLQIAIAGLVIFVLGLCVWLLRGHRTINERRIGLVTLDYGHENMPASPTIPEPAGATAALDLVRAEGMSRVHQPDCALVAGKRIEAATFADGPPCGVCHA